MARERGAVAGIVRGVVHRFDVRETGEVDEAGPRIEAKIAAVRRWLNVAVLEILSVLLPVLLMIDMALPSGVSAGE